MSEIRDAVLTPAEMDLKADSKALIRAYGGQTAAGEMLGRPQSRYCDAGLATTQVFLTIREVAVLEDRTAGLAGHPIVTRGLARRQGYELFKRPSALPTPDDFLAQGAQLLKEAGDVITELGRALADGKFCKADGQRVSREADHLIEVAVTLKAAVAQIAGEGA